MSLFFNVGMYFHLLRLEEQKHLQTQYNYTDNKTQHNTHDGTQSSE